MIKLVVFDWNGVLLSDTQACFDTDNHVIKEFGGKPIDLKTYRDTIIIPSLDFYAIHGVDKEKLKKNPEKWGEIFHAFYEKRAKNLRSRRGAHQILKWLRDNGVKSVILSNHTIEGIQFQLKRLKMKDNITKLLANSSNNQSLRGRNKLEKLKDYIEANNYKKNDAIIIGDSPEEVEMGKKVGIKTVAITGGYYSTKRLKKAEPDFLIHNLLELKEILKMHDSISAY